MFSLNDKSNGKTGIRRRPAILLLAALAMAMTGSGAWTAQAYALGNLSGQAQTTSGNAGSNSPDATCPAGGQCFADVPSGNPFYAFVNRIYQQDLVTGYACAGVGEPCDGNNRPYYRPLNTVTRQQMAKFIDNARHLPGIDIEVNAGVPPIIAHNNTGSAITAYSTSGQALIAQSSTQSAIYAQSGNATVISAFSTGGADSVGVAGTGKVGVKGTGDTGGYGVWGANSSGLGVYGTSTGFTGVWGQSTSGVGVVGQSTNSDGVHGDATSGIGVDGSSSGNYGVRGSSSTNDGVYGQSESGSGVHGRSAGGLAGYFQGNVYVTGHITAVGGCCAAGAGTYRIDDPLDSANQYLYHSAVESPDMMDIYNGNVTTDDKGEAVVTMPSYFQALNRDFRYQLTVIGQFAQAIVSSEIQDNSFSIKTDKPNVKVSWQVTGIRQDAYANAHRTPVEVAKPAGEKGKYLYPTEFGQPASMGIGDDAQQQAQTQPAPSP